LIPKAFALIDVFGSHQKYDIARLYLLSSYPVLLYLREPDKLTTSALSIIVAMSDIDQTVEMFPHKRKKHSQVRLFFLTLCVRNSYT
jgi:hypothetical protein